MSTTRYIVIPAILCAGWMVWEWTPLHEYINPSALEQYATSLRNARAPIFMLICGFVVGSMFLVPITALILLTSLTLSPAAAVMTSATGVGLGGCVGFLVGRTVGAERIKYYLGPIFKRVERHVHSRPLLSVIIIRHLPLGPFTLVNVVLGAMPLSLRDFVVGSVLSLAPTAIIITVVGDALINFRELSGQKIAVSVGVVLLAAGAAYFIRKTSKQS